MAAVATLGSNVDDDVFGGCLKAKLKLKAAEASAAEEELSRLRLEAQHVRHTLKAFGVTDGSLVPSRMEAGGACSALADLPKLELRSLLQWLVDTVDLERQVFFECGAGEGEVVVNGRTVRLQRMATWRLQPHSADLRLSVPLDQQAELGTMLLEVRQRGRLVSDLEVRRFGEVWELVGAEVISASVGQPETAIFLVHRQTSQGMVVARWPAVDFSCCNVYYPMSAGFDPVLHFSRLWAMPEVMAEEPGKAVARPRSVSTGDRVEVEYEGQWFPGVLQWVEGEFANVKCDIDLPGVITVAPLASVRPEKLPEPGTPFKGFRHARARSIG